jgi:hypothetical protein
MAPAYNLRDIPVTHWVDNGRATHPGTYQEYLRTASTSPWRIGHAFSRAGRDDDKMDVIVNSRLYDSIVPVLDTFVSDLTGDGYSISVETTSGGTPESLKSFLKSEYAGGMEGALLIGDLPIAWFQMIDDWNGDGRRDTGDYYEEFPCDLFYMDLNGTWLDTMHQLPGYDSLVPGGDGIYDQHSGDEGPEIWLGRITAAPCGNQESLVTNYLRKDHAYRNDSLVLKDRALVFIDDDWVPWDTEFDADVGDLYPMRKLISNPETTQATRYRLCLHENYQWISLFAHSNPVLHAMKYDNGQDWSWFYGDSIPGIDPLANFYNLFCCSNARFTEANYMGGRYLYASTHGLNSVGSTKEGSMLDFQYFYQPMGQGASIGPAFMDWFNYEAQGGFDGVKGSWFYGMCLNGDPTLKPWFPAHDVGPVAILSPVETVDSGAVITPECCVVNFGSNEETLGVRLTIGSSYAQTCTLSLARAAYDTVSFPIWHAGPKGVLAVRCSTELPTDTRRENDTCSTSVTVGPLTAVAERTGAQPPVFALQGVAPNPASDRAMIRYALPRAALVRISLFDITGARIRTVRLESEQPGVYACPLELEGSGRNRLPAGVYLLELEAGKDRLTRQIVIAR